MAAAALTTAMLALPSTALASRTAATSHVMTPDVSTAIAGYVWSDGTSPDSYYDFNTAGGAETITSGGTGQYSGTFTGLGTLGIGARVSYWVRCASSVMTITSSRSETTGCVSPFSVRNFWIRVNWHCL
jgi:hypothetical protein